MFQNHALKGHCASGRCGGGSGLGGGIGIGGGTSIGGGSGAGGGSGGGPGGFGMLPTGLPLYLLPVKGCGRSPIANVGEMVGKRPPCPA